MLSINKISVSLVIFTCEHREHLLLKSFQSFIDNCSYGFQKIILAIDGQIDYSIISRINPDLIIQHSQRRGYVNSILKTLQIIDTPYFFWLEDDWNFHQNIDIDWHLQFLAKHKDWGEIVLSKYGPLNADFKITPLGNDLYQTPFGFSANPALCNTNHLQAAFLLLQSAPKGDKLGADGFENFLSKVFQQQNVKCVIKDPVNHMPISHDGYLESTPRNWHMTNSLESKTKRHLLIIPVPSIPRKLYMIVKLFFTFCSLAINQLLNNKIYEYCFRILASAKTINDVD